MKQTDRRTSTASPEPGRSTLPESRSASVGRHGACETAMGLPRAPVFGWNSLESSGLVSLASVDDTEHRAYTTSGRSALYHALKQLSLPPSSEVLVPSYHCPTMVAPILKAGSVPKFFGIGSSGLPNLDSVEAAWTPKTRALIAAHYFGLPKSLAEIRAWCDTRQIVLIEDCAHTLFGLAGERPVGRWGDFATASLSKFLPVPEAGVLVSNGGPLKPLELGMRRFKDQIKGIADVVEVGVGYGRLAGLDIIVRPLLALKKRSVVGRTACTSEQGEVGAEEMMVGCDMGRIDLSPLWVSEALIAHLPRGRVVSRRQSNFARLANATSGLRGANALFHPVTSASAPYVFPLWVEEAERVYRALRSIEAPVFRWDRIWPGTPSLQGDHGRDWSRHVLQVLCHQDLSDQDIERISDVIRKLVQA